MTLHVLCKLYLAFAERAVFTISVKF